MKILKIRRRLDQRLNTYKRSLTQKAYKAALSALKQSETFLERTEQKLKGPQTSNQPVKGQSYEELYAIAKKNEIKGRSKMNKRQLEKALSGAISS